MTSFQFKQSHLYVRWLFLRLVSICFLIAFLSIAAQMVGLFGAHGILPIRPVLDLAQARLGLDAYINFPTIFWFSATDGSMQIVCSLGVVASLFALLGFFTGPTLAIAWYLYLSIVIVGQDFMSFQWDNLLLETGLLSFWFAPWKMQEIHPLEKKAFESQREVSFLFLFLLRFLCFKLMLFSGICKIASQDTTWRDLTAMTFHYETQPLPTPICWWLQKLPVAFQKLSTALVFFIELVLPVSLITLWRPARIVSASAFILLMLLIMITGNYTFFNLLTIALSITLLDDQALLSILPRSFKSKKRYPSRTVLQTFWNTGTSFLPGIIIGTAAVGFLWAMVDRYMEKETVPSILKVPIILTRPLRSFNSYGLFAMMTTSRPEIIIEGSNDGKTWLPYEFKFKPGDLHRAPPIVAPHQPRLDWQMWFASLGPVNQSPWFDHFVRRLLEGSSSVLSLMDKNPFPDQPPAQIRATLYDYHFSDFDALFQKGEWWKRTQKGEFYPPTSLEELKPVQSSPDLSY